MRRKICSFAILTVIISIILFLHVNPLHAENLTLKTTVESVIENNHDIKAARSRIEAARASILEARSSFYPSIGFSESFSRTNNPPMAFYNILAQKSLSGSMPSTAGGASGGDPFASFNNPPETNNWKTEFNVSMPLFRGWKSIAETNSAASMLSANEAGTDAVKNDLTFEAVKLFVDILKSQTLESLEREEIERLKKQLAVAESRYNNGTVLLSDVLSIRTEISRAEERLLIAKNQTEKSKSLLNAVMGRDVMTPLEVEDRLPSMWIEGADEPEWESLKNTALSSRPELRDTQFRVESLNYMLKREKSSYYPRLDSFLTYELDGHEPDAGQNSWIAGVKLSYNIFDGFGTRARVSRAAENVNEALEIRERIKLDIEKQLYSVVLDKNSAAARIDTLKNSIKEAEESLRIYEKRYNEGMVLVSELISAQAVLAEQKNRLAIAKYDYYLSSAAVCYACGTLINSINMSNYTVAEGDK